MKILYSILVLLSPLLSYSQALHIDSTRFITGNKPATNIRFAIPTNDKGILFVGDEENNPGGIIPYFPIDTVLENVLIGKIDSNHQVSWIKVYGGSEDDAASSACQTPDGGYVVLAGTTSNDGDVTGFKGAADMWLLRLDAFGNLLWEKTYGSSQSDGPISIANTPDHGFIMFGATNGSDGDVPFHYGSFFSNDWLVIKTDSTGNVQWSKDLGGTGIEQSSGSILVIADSYYLVSSTNSKDYDCTDTVWHSGVNSLDDGYIIKLDNIGNVVWSKSYGGSNDDEINYAFYDTRDNTIMTAGFTGSSDYMVTGAHGGLDQWVMKVAIDGSLVWGKAIGSKQQEAGTGICPAHNGGYIAYGNTTNASGYYDSTIIHIGTEDCWMFALDNEGNVQTDKIFGGSGIDRSASVVPFLNGYAAMGYSGSSMFTEGSCNTNYSGAFVSYFEYWPLSANDVFRSTEATLRIYPNPATDNVNVVMPHSNSESLLIVNNLGQIVYNEKVSNNVADIPIKEWANGVYCIIWRNANGAVLTNKFIKN